MMLPLQNDAMIRALESVFVRGDRPHVAWGGVVSQHLMLPGLRGFWPLSTCDESGNAYDLSEQGRTLTYNGNPTYNLAALAPYLDLDGTGDYLSRLDENGLDVIGTETYIASALRGLTVGGWFRFDRKTVAEGLITKSDGTAANTNWSLSFRGDLAGDPARITVGAGPAVYNTDSAALDTSVWYHIVGRYVPLTTLDLYVNGVKTTTSVGIPAVLNNSTAALNIGAVNGGSVLDGRASLCFLCAAALSDGVIKSLYQHSKNLF